MVALWPLFLPERDGEGAAPLAHPQVPTGVPNHPAAPPAPSTPPARDVTGATAVSPTRFLWDEKTSFSAQSHANGTAGTRCCRVRAGAGSPCRGHREQILPPAQPRADGRNVSPALESPQKQTGCFGGVFPPSLCSGRGCGCRGPSPFPAPKCPWNPPSHAWSGEHAEPLPTRGHRVPGLGGGTSGTPASCSPAVPMDRKQPHPLMSLITCEELRVRGEHDASATPQRNLPPPPPINLGSN